MRKHLRQVLAGSALLAGTAGLAAPLPPARPMEPASEAPLPPVRPPEQGPPSPAPAGPPMPQPAPLAAAPPSAAPAPAAATADEELVCARLFAGGKVVARASEPQGGPGGCGMAAPVVVSAVRIGSARQVGLVPPVEVACPLAAALADWVVQDLVPLFDHAGTPLTALTGTSGYSCRGRNRVVGAKLSEHGLGDAVDIGGLTAGRTILGVKDSHATLLASIRTSACARFTTVLGPGSDGYHEAHLHVDLAKRRNGFRLCEWDLPAGDGGLSPGGPVPRPGTGRAVSP